MAIIQSTMGDSFTAPTTAESTTPAIFRLFDRPTELRHRIGSFALHVPSRRGRDLSIPALTGVSQQLRRETLPVFFAESDFIFDVASNFVILETRAFLAYIDISRETKEASARLTYKPGVKCLIKEVRTNAVSRSVLFHVHCAYRAHGR